MSNNINLATKNALFLYLRTGVSIVIQLIAVRYLLLYLGSKDYGLYGLIGSIVALVESLKGLFSTSIQRFINIERGKNNNNAINEIFNVGLRLHIHIGIVLTLLTVVIGYISMPFLDIPLEMQTQAFCVLVISAITIGVGMAVVPYDALIIAFEKFNVFAVLSIINSCLKLSIVLVLILIPEWRVVIYALLLLGVTLITRCLNCIYCKRYLRSYIINKKITNSEYRKQISNFTGFRALGTIGQTIQSTGISYFLNIFGGLIINAARNISGQVLTAVNVLVWNINIGFSPRCLTLWGEGKKDEFYKLLFIQLKLCYLINTILGFSISLYAYPILSIWLGNVPEYTVVFVQSIFLYAIFKSFQDAMDTFFNAIGRVKIIQSIVFILNILSLGIIWILFRLQFDFYWAMLAMAIIEFVIVGCSLYIANKTREFPIRDFFTKIFIRCSISLSLLSALFFLLNESFSTDINLFSLILHFIVTLVLAAILTLPIVLSRTELSYIRKTITKIIYQPKTNHTA